MRRNQPIRDNTVRTELRRAFNRTLDFNPVIQTTAPTNESDRKGVSNAHVFLSAGTDMKLVIKVDGVNYHIAMTSAF